MVMLLITWQAKIIQILRIAQQLRKSKKKTN